MNMMEVEDNLKNYTDDSLAKEMQSPSGEVPQFMVMSELMRRKKMRMAYDGRKGQGDQPTVKEEMLAGAGVPSSELGIMGAAMAPKTDLKNNTGVTPTPGMQEGGRVGSSGWMWDQFGEGHMTNEAMSPRGSFMERPPRQLHQDYISPMEQMSVHPLDGTRPFGPLTDFPEVDERRYGTRAPEPDLDRLPEMDTQPPVLPPKETANPVSGGAGGAGGGGGILGGAMGILQDRMGDGNMGREKALALARFGMALMAGDTNNFGKDVGIASNIAMDQLYGAIGKEDERMERLRDMQMDLELAKAKAAMGGSGGAGKAGASAKPPISLKDALLEIDKIDETINRIDAAMMGGDEFSVVDPASTTAMQEERKILTNRRQFLQSLTGIPMYDVRETSE